MLLSPAYRAAIPMSARATAGARRLIKSRKQRQSTRQCPRLSRGVCAAKSRRNSFESADWSALSLLFGYLGKVDLSDYLHSDRSSLIACRDFLNCSHDTPTLESSKRLDHSHVEGLSILRRI